jgi:D-serine deaminase-like pyridoxal phosphate-dependent protein
MDWYYGEIRPEFRQAMSILVTIISRPSPDVAIVDVGRKGFGAEYGAPKVKNIPGAAIVRFGSEEHATVSLPPNSGLRVGDKIELIPSHGCTTSNLYREFVVHRNGKVEDAWPIEGAGKMR